MRVITQILVIKNKGKKIRQQAACQALQTIQNQLQKIMISSIYLFVCVRVLCERAGNERSLREMNKQMVAVITGLVKIVTDTTAASAVEANDLGFFS